MSESPIHGACWRSPAIDRRGRRAAGCLLLACGRSVGRGCSLQEERAKASPARASMPTLRNTPDKSGSQCRRAPFMGRVGGARRLIAGGGGAAGCLLVCGKSVRRGCSLREERMKASPARASMPTLRNTPDKSGFPRSESPIHGACWRSPAIDRRGWRGGCGVIWQ